MTSKATPMTIGLLALMAGALSGQEGAASQTVPRQSLDDAWWTGPLLAPNATTLPRGHFLIEPYLFDVIRYGRYDHDGNRQSAPRTNGFGSLTYVLYGLVD